MTGPSPLRDADVLPELLAMAVWDAPWLEQAGTSVMADDFKPIPRKGHEGEGTNFWVVANIALEFFKKNGVPVAGLIGQEILRWKKESNASQQRVEELAQFIKKLKARYSPERSAVLADQVAEFKKRVLRQRTLRELVELETSGQLSDEKWRELTNSVILSNNGTQAPGVLASEVTARSVDWLWKNRIPLGFLTTLDGDPGLGKSALTLRIAAYVSRSKPLAPGFPACSGGVVILSAEDDLERTIQPRLRVAGADLARVRVVPYTPERPGEEAISTLPDDIPILERAIASIDARLVIVDTLSAYLPDKSDSHNDKSMRRQLAPLAAMAKRLGVAVILVRHVPKTAPAKPVYAGIGSIGIIAAARAGFLVARDPDDESRCVMAHVKANLGPMMPSLSYAAEPVATKLGDIVRVKFIGASEHTAASLIRTDDGGKPVVERAEEYLRTALSSGPVPVCELEKAGFSQWALKQAKKALGVESLKPSFEGGFLWQLPED